MTIVAGLTASDVFYGATDDEGPISLGFKLWVIATSFKVLGMLAPLRRSLSAGIYVGYVRNLSAKD
ncbi:hypothetical protein CS078_15920 [Pseudomonas prosekii]|uniref:Uncharacterized protein n=1 Tax=Pseudomonas prosekii TaxID=1148509 RepID=A0A3L8CV96_9PSED|nr:hypothetical protein CS078_15920 [Pseudomonas prosekii]RLU11771.1 hypothetical protein CS076_08970 [Pseudomonas prosekii]